MEILIGFISLLALVGFFILCSDIGKMRTAQKQTNKFLAEQNNLLSEQITIMRSQNSKDNDDGFKY